MAQEQERQGGGRPVERGTVKRVTLELPAELWEYITLVSSNRTKWIIEAIKEKRAREKEQAKFFAKLNKKDGS